VALNTTSLLDLLNEQMSLKVILVYKYTERGVSPKQEENKLKSADHGKSCE